MAVAAGEGGDGGGGGIDGGERGDAALGGGAADLKAVTQGGCLTALRRVDYHVHQPLADDVDDVRVAFVQPLWHLLDGQVDGPEHGRGALRRINAIAALGQAACDGQGLRLGAVGEAEEDGAAVGQRQIGGVERLGQGGLEGVVHAHHLAGRLHLRAEVGIYTDQLGHGEDRRLDRHELTLGPKPRLVA